MKRVIIVTKNYGLIGGVEKFVDNLRQYLIDSGYTVEIWTRHLFSADIGYEVINIKDQLLISEKISSFIKDETIFITINDVINYIYPFISDFKIILAARGQFSFWCSKKEFFEHEITYQELITLTPEDQNSFKFYGNKNVNYIPNYISGQNEIKAKFDGSLVMCGRFSEEKGFEDLLKLAKGFNKNTSIKCYVSVLESARQRFESLKQKIIEEGLAEKIIFIEGVTDKNEIYANKSICLNLSSIESFGNAVLEAMSYGLPIISYNVTPGLNYLVDMESNPNGYLIDFQNYKKMNKQIKIIRKNKKLWKKLSINSKKRSEYFTEAHTLEKWKKLIDNVLGSSPIKNQLNLPMSKSVHNFFMDQMEKNNTNIVEKNKKSTFIRKWKNYRSNPKKYLKDVNYNLLLMDYINESRGLPVHSFRITQTKKVLKSYNVYFELRCNEVLKKNLKKYLPVKNHGTKIILSEEGVIKRSNILYDRENENFLLTNKDSLENTNSVIKWILPSSGINSYNIDSIERKIIIPLLRQMYAEKKINHYLTESASKKIITKKEIIIPSGKLRQEKTILISKELKVPPDIISSLSLYNIIYYSNEKEIEFYLLRDNALNIELIICEEKIKLKLVKTNVKTIVINEATGFEKITEIINEPKHNNNNNNLSKNSGRGNEIVVITGLYPSSGNPYANQFVHTRVKEMVKQGLNVKVYVIQANYQSSNQPENYQFENIEIELHNSESLNKALQNKSIKYIFVHFNSPKIYEVISKYPKIKKFIWVHGGDIQSFDRRKFSFNIKDPFAKILRQYEIENQVRIQKESVLMKNTHFIFPSNWLYNIFHEDVLTNGDVLKKKIIISNPINLRTFNYVPKIKHEMINVVSVKSFNSKIYANDIVIDAIEKLSEYENFSMFNFTIVGKGALWNQTTAKLKNKKYENIKFINDFLEPDELATLYQNSDLTINVTRSDSQGVSRLESMATGTPTISTNIAAIPEFVSEKTSFFEQNINTNTSQNLVDKIIEFSNLSYDQRMIIGQANANYVKKTLNVEDIVKNELKIIENI